MKLLKSSFIVVISMLVLGLVIAPSAMAADPLQDACNRAQSASACQNRSADNPIFGPKGLVTRATQIVTIAVGAAAVIMIIIGGFRYVLSAGDSNATQSARNMIIYAVVGLIIALVAQSLVLFVLRRL